MLLVCLSDATVDERGKFMLELKVKNKYKQLNVFPED